MASAPLVINVAKYTAAQLAKLSKEDKLKLLDLIDKKKEAKKQRRAAFVPHKEQELVAVNPSKIRIVTSGNGWGKSAFGVNEALWALSGLNPITNKNTYVPCRVVVVLDAPSKVADVWLPELKKWTVFDESQLHKDGKPFYSRLTFPNGSELRFMFQLQEELAFESIEADFFIFDEPPPRSIWVALLRAGRTKGREPRYLIIATPISQAWLREYFVEWEKGHYPDTMFFTGTTRANEANLASGYIEEFSRHLTERERKTRLEGAFFNTEGLALAEQFNRRRHLVTEASLDSNYRIDWPHVIAIDNHPNKPNYACLLAAAPDGTKYYVAETAQKVVPREFGLWLQRNWIATHNIKDIICDNMGNGDMTGGEGFKSFIEVLTSMGIRVRATSFDDKADDAFLTRLQEGLFIPDLGEPVLKFLNTCIGIIRDIENVAWKPIKGTETYQPKLEISNRDYLACLKYALASNLTYDNARRKIHKPITRAAWMGKEASKPGKIERGWGRNRKDDDFSDF